MRRANLRGLIPFLFAFLLRKEQTKQTKALLKFKTSCKIRIVTKIEDFADKNYKK